MQKNQIAEVEITGTTTEGYGVGRVENMAVFVPLAAEGDRLEIKIIKVAKNYAVGRIEKVISASPARVEADCSVFNYCGGCVFRHISYEEELRIKHQRVADAMARIGGFSDLEIAPIVQNDSVDCYRNKAQFPIGTGADGKLQLGFYATHSHRLVPCEECKLHPAEFVRIAELFIKWANEQGLTAYDEEKNSGRLRHLCIRRAVETDEIMVCIVVNAGGIPNEQELVKHLTENVPQIKSIIINVNREKTNVIYGRKCRTVYGDDYITDTLCGLNFRISPLSFYQVNHDQAQKLYGIAKQEAKLSGDEVLLDLYCGTGTIGLSMANNVKKLIGVEIVEQAVEDAKRNAEQNGITNAEFLCADATQAAQLLVKRGEKPDIVVVDPPRKGCDEAVLKTIATQMQPERIVYISCDPATLARDLKKLSEYGYSVGPVTPVDMFSRTAHVESVVCLTRK